MEWTSAAGAMIDLHSHVIPGVDDGARDPDEGVAAVHAFLREGVGTVVATPHLAASRGEIPGALPERLAELDAGLERLREALREAGVEIRLERGAEVRLDAPEPDLSDARLRLAGTRFALVEFPAFRVPAFGDRQLQVLREEGWLPVLAHPERYLGVGRAMDRVAAWREHAFFQVNARSLLGRYGREAGRAARAFLELGWIDYLSSDYHARGEPGLAAARELLEGAAPAPESTDGSAGEPAEAVGPGSVRDGSAGALLTETNAARLLRDEEPVPVPPLLLPEEDWRRAGLASG